MMDLKRIEELEKHLAAVRKGPHGESVTIRWELCDDLLAAAKKWVEASTAFQEGYGIADYEERIAALEKENSELVTKCNRLEALVREAKNILAQVATDTTLEWRKRAKAELEGNPPRRRK